MKRLIVVLLYAFCMNVSAYELGPSKIFITDGKIIEATQDIYSNQTQKLLISEKSAAAIPFPEVTLYPKNGNYAVWTINLAYSNGSPAPNIPLTVSFRPYTLTSPEWRNATTMVNRFTSKTSQDTARERINSGLFRLKAPVSPLNGVTDAKGQFRVTIKNFHSCGNESTPASDLVSVTFGGSQSLYLRVNCAVDGLSNIPDNESGGLTTSGLVGRHLHPSVLAAMQYLGAAWKSVPNKPGNTPDYLVITGATMHWGGINPPHFTHKFGGTLDIRPIGNKPGKIKYGTPGYDPIGTQAIVTALVQLGATRIIFADNLNGVTHVRSNHGDHLHVSFLNQPEEPWFVPNGSSEVDDEGESWIDYETLNDPGYFEPTIFPEYMFIDEHIYDDIDYKK
jgi:hypothetical protein